MKPLKKLFDFHAFPISALILVAVISHLQWFSPSSVIAWGDWTHWPMTVVGKLSYLWNPWINFIGLGYPNIQVNYLFFTGIWSLLANFGVGYDISSKLTIFIPIALLSFISPYILSYKLSENKKISFLAALFYGTTTYGLFVQQPIQFVYSLAPLIIFLFILALEKQRLFNWLLFNIIFWVGVCYEPRVMIIIAFVLLILFLLLFDFKSKKNYLFILLSVIIQVGLNLFWILPILFRESSGGVGQLTSRGIFGDNLQDILHAFTIYIWQWTGSYPNDVFIQQDVKFYFWIFPILAFSVFLFKNLKEKKIIFAFGIIALLGIFLSKQSSFPIVDSYRLLHNFVPGFSIFREATKFYLLVAIGYLGLITYAFKYMKSRYKRVFLACSILLICACLYTLKPLLTGEIGTLFVSRSIPEDYATFTKALTKQNNFFRILWVPTGSSWSPFDDVHPAVNAGGLVGANLEKLANAGDPRYTEAELITSLLKGKYGNHLLDETSIKYVVIPIEENVNDFLKLSGRDRNYFLKQLKEIEYLKKIDLGTNKLAVFENENYAPHAYISSKINPPNYKNVNPVLISPNRYQFNLDQQNIIVNFSEAYDPNWKVRVGKFDLLQSLFKKDFYLPEQYHAPTLANLNSFYIKAPNKQVQNTNLTITIFFQTMIYFYIGLAVTVVTLLTTIFLAIIAYLKDRQK